MYIERIGDGPRTFFGLHGWSGDHNTFTPLTSNLPIEASFFSADLPGCGASPPPLHWTLDHIAAEIAQSIGELPGPVTLVGNCSGGLLGIAAARLVPGKIERFVLIDLFATFPWYFHVFLTRPFGRYAYASTFQNPIGRWMTNLSLRGKRKSDTTLTGGFARVDHGTTYRYLQIFESYPKPETFRELTSPVQLLVGEKSFRAVHNSVPVWQSVWPQAEAILLAGAGHLPILEATMQLRDILYQAPRRSRSQNREAHVEHLR